MTSQTPGWTDDEEDDLRPRWRTLTADEIRSRKEIASEKIEAAMQELYLSTGINFNLDAQIVRHNELNAKTQWTARSTYRIHLRGYI